MSVAEVIEFKSQRSTKGIRIFSIDLEELEKGKVGIERSPGTPVPFSFPLPQTKNSSSRILRQQLFFFAAARRALISGRPVIFLASSAEHNLFPMPDETHCRRDDAGARSLLVAKG